MITLNRLNGEPILVSAMQIESVESNPDTRVTLMNGRQLYVRQTPAEVTAAMLDWFRQVNRRDQPGNAPGGI